MNGPMSIRSVMEISRHRWMLVAVALACAAAVPVRAQTPTGEVVEAVVTYGDDKLIEQEEALTDERLASMLDSLCPLDPAPRDLIRDLRLYQRIRRMDEFDMVFLIDSLFDLDTVPYALVNEINLYVDRMPSRAEVDRSHVLAWDRNAMPGMDIYGHWSDRDPNARAVGLAAIDTVLQLKLSGDGPGEAFQVPVPPVVTSRYGWRDGRNHNGIDLDLEMA